MNALVRALVGAALLVAALGGRASAQECETCYTGRCADLAKKGIPPCLWYTPPAARPERAERAPETQLGDLPKAGPAPRAGADEECPLGKEMSDDTWGHCCWPGQAWSGTACVGFPASCQEGFMPSEAGDACVPRPCPGGQVRTADGVHCCHPGQAWKRSTQSCVGRPVCQDGFDVVGDRCELRACPDQLTRASDGVHCCWPGQFYDGARRVCQGTPACPPLYAPSPARDRCVPAACEEGKVRAADGLGCCWPGQSWDGRRCGGRRTDCAPGYVASAGGDQCELPACTEGRNRSGDGVHCCFPGQGWDVATGACAGRRSDCGPLAHASEDGQRCEPNACEAGRLRAADGLHCCWPGQGFDAAAGLCTGPRTDCGPGRQAGPDGSTCVPMACEPGKLRAADGLHCCRPGQLWSEATQACTGARTDCAAPLVASPDGDRCVPAPCAEGFLRSKDGLHCCAPGLAWSDREARCAGRRTDCGNGLTPSERGDECVPVRCELAGLQRIPGGRLAAPLSIEVAPFCIDRVEVTVSRYLDCVTRGGCTPAGTGPGCNGADPSRREHPINCVTGKQAAAFCAWRNKRLPSEVEWEWAARGASPDRPFPWGDDPPQAQACWDGVGSDAGAGARSGTCVAGAHEDDQSPQKVLDLAGNVREWTRPLTGAVPAATRGGAWTSSKPAQLQATSRATLDGSKADIAVGFRCARDP